MIVYLDTSSVVKLYFQEVGSAEVRELRDGAENLLFTSRVTYAEVRSALARRKREGRFNPEATYHRSSRDFNRDWRRFFFRIALLERVVRLAGDLAEQHALRGYDAVHLASGLILKDRLGLQVSFSTWDIPLRQAAAIAGLLTTRQEVTP